MARGTKPPSQQELADTVHEAARAFNRAVSAATSGGLRCKLSVRTTDRLLARQYLDVVVNLELHHSDGSDA